MSMSLHLDARQRAMLQEMGVTVWAPAQAVADAAVAATAPQAQHPARPVEARGATAQPDPSAGSTSSASPAPSAPTAAPVASAAPNPRPPAPANPTTAARAAATPRPGAANTTPTAGGAATPALRLHPPQPLYPTADPSQTPAELGGGWLIVTESVSAAEPLQGDAGRLLDNMLRAMRLHRHPRVFVAALERTLPGMDAGDTGEAIATTLAQAVQTLQPAMVLVLGHVAARAALGRTEPLGRLRAGPHELAGCPAVVTYDPAFLLRSQDVKAAAWADLCHALALVRAACATA